MKIKTKFIVLGIALVFSFLVFNFSFAARTFFETDNGNVQVGDTFETNFFIDTEGQGINAIEGTIIFPQKIVSLKEINDGNSIINFWIKRPAFKDGEISFSGIIPGGYSSKKGLILTLVFQSLSIGEGQAQVKNINILANDGSGTPVVQPVLSSETIQVSKASAREPTSSALVNMDGSPASSTSPIISVPNSVTAKPASALEPAKPAEIKDTVPPEIFEPKVVSDSNMFDGKYFLVFATQDKGSGIDHYQVLEKKTANILGCDLTLWQSGWITAENPYLLKDQSLGSSIQMKAVDKAGNERNETISAKNPINWYEIWWVWVAIAVVLTIFVLAVYSCVIKGWKRKTQKK